MEIWDLYDEKRRIIGEHVRGAELPDGGYHLVVHVWIRDSRGRYLIAQRSPSRASFPLIWEAVGGSVLKGESSLQGALREVMEEVGIDLSGRRGTLVFSEVGRSFNGRKFNDILDVWLFEYDGAVELQRALTDEVADTKWLYREEISDLCRKGVFMNTQYYFFERIADRPQWIFFDIGSTLVDEAACMEARYAESTENTPVLPSELKAKTEELAAICDQPYKEALAFFGLQKAKWRAELERPYPEAAAVLAELAQKYRLGAIANQPAELARRLESWGIGKYFDLVIASGAEGVEKPDAEIFRRALRRAGCAPESAVMVGDRLDNDILPARQVGMRTVWVRQGLASRRADSDIPDRTVASLAEITKIL